MAPVLVFGGFALTWRQFWTRGTDVTDLVHPQRERLREREGAEQSRALLLPLPPRLLRRFKDLALDELPPGAGGSLLLLRGRSRSLGGGGEGGGQWRLAILQGDFLKDEVITSF